MKQRHHGILSDPVRLLPNWRARELFDYEPPTGVLYWRERPIRLGPDVSRDKGWNNRFAGKPAGCLTSFGYILVRVTPTLGEPLCVLAHRLAWTHYYDAWPDGNVDHRNRIRNDNRIANLRLASRPQNFANSYLRKDNTSGVKGVSYQEARGKWRARLNIDSRQVYYGYFDTKEAAILARQKAAHELLGEFANETPVTYSETGGSKAS